MAAFDPATLDRWRALAIVDRDGTTVGTISEFYLDRETGQPTWALVETGLFGATQTFVPLVDATEIADGLQVPYEKRHIKDSPRVDPHDELTPDEEASLFAHYGVDYEPAAPGTVEGTGPESGTPEGPGPVPVDAATEQEMETAPDAPGTAGDPGPVPAEPGRTGEPGPVPVGPGSTGEPGPVPVEPGTGEAPGPIPGQPGTAEEPAAVPVEPGTAGGPKPVSGEPGTTEGPGPVPGEPGTTGDPETVAGSSDTAEIHKVGPGEPGSAGTPASDPSVREEQPGTFSGEPGTAEGPGRVPLEVGTDEATLISPRGFGPPEHSEDFPDPGLSRTAPVEPGLPGSTAASPGPVPATVDKDSAYADGRPADDPLRDPDDSRWHPVSAGSFDDHPVDRPAGTSDRWREAKLAAERERLGREAAQPEERSPLERARRRLERLVGVSQDHSDDDITAQDREAAERARRARLGFDEDDPRFR